MRTKEQNAQRMKAVRAKLQGEELAACREREAARKREARAAKRPCQQVQGARIKSSPPTSAQASVPPSPIPRLVVIAADPPSLLDSLPREVLSPHALRGPTGETAANSAILRNFETEDAPAAKATHGSLFESKAEGGKGLSQRQAAKQLGVSHETVRKDLATKLPKSGNKVATESRRSAPSQQRYETLVIDPPWPIAKIERDVRPNQGDTAAKVELIPLSESEDAAAKRQIFDVFEPEDAEAKQESIPVLKDGDAAAKANKYSHFESDETAKAIAEFEAEETEFQRQLKLVREDNARAYANRTPWPVKK